jgi:membrane-bound serine protease (ClpP class)
MIALGIARVSRRLSAALLGGWLACALAAPAAAQAVEQAQPPAPAAEAAAGQVTVYRIPVNGVVEMGLAPFISRSLREAAAHGAEFAVLDIDTPGGRVDAAQQISDALSDATIPVYAFVNRRALSAGALIALATNGIYMRPGSTLGAATPVTGEGERASEKIVSAMRSEFRALAEAGGKDPRVAEAMVDEEIEIAGIVERGKLLTLSTQDATRIGYAQEVSDWDALMAQLGVTEAEVVTTAPNWAERLVRFFTHPLVAPFLLSFGFLGLLIEVKTPAFGLAGLAGVVSLGLFFGSHLIIGLAGWEVIILLAIGVMLLLVEALILPGFGVAGVLGAAAVGVSIFLSLIGKMPTMFDMMIAMQVIGTAVIIVGVTSWQLLKRLPQDRRAQGLLHQTSMRRELGYSSAALREDLIGLEGVTLTDLRPAGTARFGEERVDVVSSGSWVQAGTPVRVVRSEGYRHIVEPV